MIEWLKNILGDSWTEDIDKKIDTELDKGFVARADFTAAEEAKKTAEPQLAEANKTIAGYKEMDIDAIRKSAADWQAKAEQAQTPTSGWLLCSLMPRWTVPSESAAAAALFCHTLEKTYKVEKVPASARMFTPVT